MQNIKPISELRNYSKLLNEVKPGEPVYLTKNGHGKYVLLAIEDYEKPKRHVQHQRNRSEINSDEKVEKPSAIKRDNKVQPTPSKDDNGSNIPDNKTNMRTMQRLPENMVIVNH